MDEGPSRIYKLRKLVPVGSKKDPICNNTVYLSLIKPTTFGRVLSEEVQVRLLSKSTPLMISRKHATISIRDGVVFVSDHDSINGVYIQNKRIKPGIPCEIKTGETITFGCGVGNDPPEFEYVLEISKNRSYGVDILGSPSKRQRVVELPVITIIESNAAQIKEQENKIKRLTSDLEQKEIQRNELVNKFEEKEKGLIAKLEKQKQDIEIECSNAEQQLKKLLQEQLREKENVLRTEYDEQLKCLKQEKENIERTLQEELSKQLNEKDKSYQLVLEHQKSNLEQQMLSKENEKNMLLAELQIKEGLIQKYKSVEENQKQLEDCLEELKKEILQKDQELQKQVEVTKKVEIDAKQTVIQTIEDEFTCIICQELFIDATTLPCAHTFCELCLRMWMRKKKNCPVCRRRIKDKAVRSLVLDSAVEKMIEAMDTETKERRTKIVQERIEQKIRDDATEDPEGVKNLFHRLGEDEQNTAAEDNTDQQRNERHSDNRNRRDGYRRRSRSRSPRYYQRHRPYYDNRNGHVAGFQQQNIGPFFQHNVSGNNSRYYYERGANNPSYFHGNFNSHYGQASNQVLRCYYCGGADHIARFCQRR